MRLGFTLKKLRLLLKMQLFNLIKMCLPKREFQHYKINKIKSILLIRNDKIGDLVVTSPLIRYLYNSGYDVYVSSIKTSLQVIEYSPYIKGIFCYDDSSFRKMFTSLRKLRKQHFDLVIDLKLIRHIDIKHLLFCAFSNTDNLLGFNKSNVRSYNISIPYYEENLHITEQFKTVLPLLGIDVKSFNYDIFVNSTIDQDGEKFIDELRIQSDNIIVFNPSGGTDSRIFSSEQIEAISELLLRSFPDSKIIIIGEPKFLSNLDISCSSIVKYQSASILSVVPVIKYADMIVTVDTSIVHIACAFDKKMIAIYPKPPLKASLSLKERTKIEYNLFKFRLYDEFFDKPYLKSSNKKSISENCYNIWRPNNINAEQLTFEIHSLSEVPIDLLVNNIQAALR